MPNIKKFEVEAVRTDSYTIEVDEDIWNEAERKNWSSVFWQIDSVEDVAEAVAGCLIRQEPGAFWEGFGHVKTFLSSGTEVSHYKKGFERMEEDELCKGITVYLHDHDEEFEYNLEEKI